MAFLRWVLLMYHRASAAASGLPRKRRRRTIRAFSTPTRPPRGAPMQTGMNLLLWTTHVTDALYPTIGRLKAAGFDGVEVPVFEGDATHYKKVAAELKKQGLRCTTVTVVT